MPLINLIFQRAYNAPSLCCGVRMSYESLFWSMVAVVAFALCTGVLAGCLKSMGATLSAVALSAAVVLAVCAASGGEQGMALPLGAAAALFCLVIACASGLLTRRIRQRQASR